MARTTYHKGDEGIDAFTVKGDQPKELTESSMSKPSDDVGADEALGALGAGLRGAKKYSSLNADGQKIDIPKSGGESLYGDRGVTRGKTSGD